eukprot:CAMPEP_0172828114 /NCGR_PEP_ID=MMETSP1075-20121228/20611_1 /TAXON_ID=2916 /ORGANISM="Ceratium fusus, Strain PA161109" /LENGTH=503 /DNA_ID=CAMNT_0013670063 /DNA_START=45 /DNA_END=1556 /DNA_ORIENTATION=+
MAQLSPAEPRQRPRRFRTCEEQAFDFVAVATTSGSDADRELTATRNHPTQLSVVQGIIVTCICVPMFYFIITLPLAIRKLPTEPWICYYWAMMTQLATFFARTWVWYALELVPSRAASLIMWLCAVSCQSMVTLLPMPCSLVQSTSAGALFLCMYFQFTSVLRGLCRSCDKPSISFVLVFTIGVIPSAITVTLMHLFRQHGLNKDIGFLAMSMTLWTVLPIVLKSLGRHLVTFACPCCPALGPIFWTCYVEMVFSNMGLVLYHDATLSICVYTLTFCPITLVHIARGSYTGYKYCPCMKTFPLHRLYIFLEAFAGLLGRVSSYTFFLCFATLQLLGVNTAVDGRSSLTDIEVVQIALDPYSEQDISQFSLVAGIFGLILTIGIFLVFVCALPYIWGSLQKPAGMPRQATQPSAHVLGSRREVAWTGGQVTPPSYAWGEDTVVMAWSAELTNLPTWRAQFSILQTFMELYRNILVVSVFWVGAQTSLLTALVATMDDYKGVHSC